MITLKNLSIKSKLIFLTIVSMLLLSIILTIMAIKDSSEILIKQKYNALTTARDSKVNRLQDIFTLYKKQIDLLSNTTYVKDITLELKNIHRKKGFGEYGDFPVNDPAVKKTYPKWDEFYRDYTNTYPFDDVYIMCVQHGHVLYSYRKFDDFGTNLSTGKYKKSGLAKIWNKVKKYKKSVFVDMQPYAPRKNEPTMFVGTPVYIDGKLESILVFTLDSENLKNIMQFRSGYGTTQEDYLVGEDYLMRSDSFLSPVTHSVKNSFVNTETGTVKTFATIQALKGETGTQIVTDYRGEKVLSAYTPFEIDEELKWAVLSEIDLNEVMKEPNETMVNLIIAALLSFVMILIIVIFIIDKYLIKSVDRFKIGLLQFFDYLNGDNKKLSFLDESSQDEIGIMSNAVNKGIEKTKLTMEKNDTQNWIKNGVNELNQILININDLTEVSRHCINFLSTYSNMGVGVFYIYDEQEEVLVQYGSYAHVQRDELSSKFKLSEGVVGQAAAQRTPILLKNIKKNESLITTGTIIQSSYNTYTFPLIYNDTLYGVIELGSFEPLSEKVLEFFSACEKTICIALTSAIQNEKVNELLERTQKINEELQIKQDELEKANKSMQEQQQQLEEANVNLEEQQQQLEEANTNMEEQQQQLEEANASMEEQQQQLKISEQNLKLQNKQLEDTKKEIEKKAEELAQSGKYKSEFLANMSHELRTPLNSIILLSSLLKKNTKNTLTNDDIKKARTIFESGNELLRLINDILDLSKVESGKMEVIVDSFESTKFLEQMKEVFDFTATDKGLLFDIIDEYKGIICSDKDRISQIIRNLVSNAFKFTKEGSITLKIAPSKYSDKEIEVSVTDTGIGIPKEKQEDIFKAFTQADGSTSREYGGTGLGLSISRELSKLLGGTIKLESTEGKGSTFSIDLPMLDSEDVQKSVLKPVKKEIKPIKQEEVESKPFQSSIEDDRDKLTTNDEAYLIIDDDKTFAEVVYEEIKNSGSYALIALDGTSGLDLVKKYNIKGIMLDLTLPDMDGVDILKELKSDNETRHIPVHIISSKDKDTYTLELGAIGYLQKPVLDGDINNVITSIDHFQQKKIKDLLIVEDDQVHREALIELIGEGVNITGVQSAGEAINEVKKEKYDTVVVDLGLIDGSGYEVCEYIKNTHPKLPIIIYTGRELTKDDKTKLQEYSNSIIMKTANSNDRILNEINLFLHRDESDQSNQTETVLDEVDLEGKKILIVDDDIKNIFVLEAALQEFQATTYSSFNGKEALEFLDKNSDIDLILMDIMMPVMNGYEAMKLIRENEKIKDIPIIAVTAKAMKDDREKCISLGADDYLSKPIDLNILGDLIKQWSLKKHK